MKLWITKDEWWPVFELITAEESWRSGSEPSVEVSEDDYADYQRVMAEFSAWQDRLDELQSPRSSA
jgi:hypothetical protein